MAALTRPKLSIPRARTELVLEISGLISIIGLLAFTLRTWPTLPEVVPVHFGFSGDPDAWGHRKSLGFIPVLAVGFYVVLSLLERVPHIYNYPVPVTPENARRLYLLGRQLVLALKVIITGSFAVLFYTAVMISRGRLSTLGVWYLPTVLLSVGLVLCVVTIRMIRTKAQTRD